MNFRVARVRVSEGIPGIEGDSHAAFGLSVPDEEGRESGVAAHWLWDGERLEIRSDRHGYVPLYYHHDRDSREFLVSDSPIALLASGIPGVLDTEVLGFFCRAGFVLGDRTLYRGIRRLPADTTLVWSVDGLAVHDHGDRFRGDPPGSPREALDGWIDRFRVAMARRRPRDTEFGMPLSGGRDSRMMLMELRALGHHPEEVVSFGPGVDGENEDLVIARTIAERLGLRHSVARNARGWLDLEHERHAWCGCEALEHTWLLGLWRHFRSTHRCWYDGLGVGAMTRGELNKPHMLEFLHAGDIDGFCTEMFRQTAAPPERWVERVLSAMDLDLPDRGSVIEHARQEIVSHVDAPNPLGRFSFCNWGRRAIALNPYGICRDVAEVHTPFMDRDLVDWVASVPAEWTFENDLQTDACLRLHPELADIDFDSHRPGGPAPGGFRRRILNRIEKRRFFNGPGRMFRDVAGEAMGSIRRDPGANRALTLMVHLVLADASRDPEQARSLLRHASATSPPGSVT